MISKECKFELTDDEYDMLKAWWDENFKGNYFGAIGGELSIKFTPTSIGTVVEAECGDKKIVLSNI